jgi:hypothetical protein
MNTKSKRKCVSIEYKRGTIKRLGKGETVKRVASEQDVGEVTLGTGSETEQKIYKREFVYSVLFDNSRQPRYR